MSSQPVLSVDGVTTEVIVSGQPASSVVAVDGQPMSSGTLPLVPSDCGRWCIVKYCDQLYPGLIQAVENNKVLVRALHPIGINKFTNPRYVDELWYDKEDFLGIIDEPTKPSVRSRFVHVQNWDRYQAMLDA